MKVGISFVSVANARANLAAENARLERRRGRPRRDRRGGTRCSAASRSTAARTAEQQTFYSALYHSLLHPNVFSDENGEYPGFDRKVHTAAGYTQYANFSGWDIYRSEMQLLALVEPRRDRRHDALAARRLRAERLPPEVAVRRLRQRRDQRRLRRSDPRRRVRVRRPQLRRARGAARDGEGRRRRRDRRSAGTSSARTTTSTSRRAGSRSTGATRRRSTTRSAARRPSSTRSTTARSRSSPRALGDRATAATFTKRAGNWRNLFNPATGYLAARRADGSFPPGPAFQRSPLPGIGQDGWEEGNAIQYTWSVPQDLRGLFDAMGGNASVVAQARPLLHAPQHQPQAAVRLGRQRARARHPVGVRLRGRAVAHARRRAPHRHRALRADAERRARQRRPRRDVVVVRVGGDRACIPETPGHAPTSCSPARCSRT